MRKKLSSILSNQRRRAKGYGQTLDYGLAELSSLFPSAHALGRCEWCGTPLTVATFQADHRLAVSKGGAFDLNNLVPSCADCNRAKADLMPDDWALLLAALKRMTESGRNDVMGRLKSGAALKHGWKPRRRAYRVKFRIRRR